MDDIKIYKKIELNAPVMLAGWPGMGSVAVNVVEYLQKKLNAVKFAQIQVDPLSTLDSVVVKDGLATLPPPPQNIFYYSKDPDLIIFEGESQIAGQGGIALLNKVLDVALHFKVSAIYTGAAFPLPVSHSETPQLYGAVNRKAIMPLLMRSGVLPMDVGHISGLNGLILGFAKERNIDAACLLATMPQYAISLPNPKAAFAIIETLQKILGFKVNMLELGEYMKEMDEKMALIEDKVKDVLTIEKEEHRPAQAEKKVPGYIVDKIENLFQDAKKDKTKAMILKIELDRWDLYHTYEDRFLDLFKSTK